MSSPRVILSSEAADRSPVAEFYGVLKRQVQRLVTAPTEGRTFGFFHVNVLELNLALDSQFPVKK